MRIKLRLGYHHLFFFSLFSLFLIQPLPLGSQERFRRSPPLPEPVPELSLPLVETHTLTNGLEIAVVRRQDKPVISMRLIIMAGESSSPDNIPGIATLCGRMITKGSVNLRAEEIEKKIESLGGQTLLPKTEIPNIGWFALFADPTGNRVGLFTGLEGQP